MKLLSLELEKRHLVALPSPLVTDKSLTLKETIRYDDLS